MASIRKRGKTWRAEVRLRGTSESASFATKGEAVAWAVEKEGEIIAVGRGQLPKKTFAQALTKYAEEVSPTKKGARWEQIRLKLLGRYKIAKILLAELKAPDIAAWRDERLKEVSAPSVRRELNLIGSVLEICRREWHWLHENPLRDVRRPQNRAPRRRGMSQDEIDRIVLALGFEEGRPITQLTHEVAVALLLSVETAMRQGEILGLTPDAVNLDGRFVTLPETKNGDRRDVPLSTRAVALLRKLLTEVGGFTVKSGSADVFFRRARDAAGCAGVHFHDARSEALTRLSKKLDVLQLAKMVGHRDPRSLMFYYNESASDTAKLLD